MGPLLATLSNNMQITQIKNIVFKIYFTYLLVHFFVTHTRQFWLQSLLSLYHLLGFLLRALLLRFCEFSAPPTAAGVAICLSVFFRVDAAGVFLPCDVFFFDEVGVLDDITFWTAGVMALAASCAILPDFFGVLNW